MSEVCNIAASLPAMAARRPHTPAIYYPHARTAAGRVAYTHYTYAQLDRASDELAAGLDGVGVGRGVRAVLMVRPSLEFFALTFALFKAGAVPVIVDPGIGLRPLGVCLAEAEPHAFVGVTAAHVARAVLRWGRATITRLVTIGPRLFWGGPTLSEVRALGARRTDWRMAETGADEPAAILFTSGSTGIPKGAVYTHGNFVAQVERIRETYDIRPGEIDLPTFPLFALFDPALGMTTVVPDMDPRAPAKVRGRRIAEAVEDFGVTNMFGSPALLRRVVAQAGIGPGSPADSAPLFRLPTVRRVISAGAPVPPDTIQRFLRLCPSDARIHTPFGATESLPVASIDSAEILGETAAATALGRGVCVGRPVRGSDVRIIATTDDAIAAMDDARVLPTGEVGEITVAGPMVTASYFNRDASTRLAKIADPTAPNGVRHRMGDVGYFDDRGRLWFCGRKSHRVVLEDGTTLYSALEGIFDAEFGRTALVGPTVQGRVVPALCVETMGSKRSGDWAQTERRLRAAAARDSAAALIERFLRFEGCFPVDIRHNSKIRREVLRDWAATRLGSR